MISRLTAYAAAFACIGTTTFAWATHTSQADLARAPRAVVEAPAFRDAAPIVRLDTVVVTGRRSAILARN